MVLKVLSLFSSVLLITQLRDELYCQLMKQLTANPSPESIDHGFTLMSLLLSTFPPSAELENYLEMFLRGKREDECIKKLHLIVYGEPVPGIPRMHQIEGLRGKGRRFSLWGRADANASDSNKPSRRPAAKKMPSVGSKGGGKTPVKPRRRGSVEAVAVPKSAAPPPLPSRSRPMASEVVPAAASANEPPATAVVEPVVAATERSEVETSIATGEELAAAAEAAADAAAAVAVAEEAPAEVPLPEGWQEFEAEGKLFYYHTESGRTQWDRPA